MLGEIRMSGSGQNTIVLRTVYALDPRTGQYLNPNQMLVTDGIGGTKWVDSISTFIISGGTVMNDLPSTIQYYSTAIYTNTMNFQGVSSISTDMYTAISSLSTAIANTLPGAISKVNLVSTVAGLGSSGYVSTSGVYKIISNISAEGNVSGASVSTIVSVLNSNYKIIDISTTTSYIQTSSISSFAGLGTLGYLSTANLTSTVRGLGSSGYISSTSLTSSIRGLGTIGYISTFNLVSSVIGLGSLGYISSYTTLTSTVIGLGSVNYVSTDSLVSTVDNLKTFYTSNAGVTGVMLASTVEGLANSSYVSTSALVSTTQALSVLRTSTRIDDAGNVIIIGGINNFSNTSNIIYISSFLMSSVTYSGNQGYTFNATKVPGLEHDLTFSTASIDLSGFSNYIASNSRVTIDVYPNIAFSKLATGATTTAVLPISTFLKYGNTNMYSTTVTSFLNVINTRVMLERSVDGFPPVYVDQSNFFNTPIKLTVPTGDIKTFSNTYNLVHYMPSSLNFSLYQNALHSNDITPFFGSTGSLFVSIQNLPTY
jgi:hypothetical protein